MLVAGGADTQLGLGSSYVLAPLATNVDLWKPIVNDNVIKYANGLPRILWLYVIL